MESKELFYILIIIILLLHLVNNKEHFTSRINKKRWNKKIKNVKKRIK